ncbi:uncharacterized protein LOC124152360 [Haliotis rufescens]|uniref:uncharacterized protein LOC124152360 n=1 Tax=Haliotis rufescens TaxID=6454 RepID=UPI001EAFBC6B|nr:uncharacterized protein LOC124152360 [Haliotis rufescens]
MVLKTCLLLCGLLGSVTPHGYLSVPLQRSSMWRGGFAVPANYDDNGLRCGGPTRQFNKNSGRCGICGDPWDATDKENEAGGKYASGIISKTYNEGDRMAVEVVITSNHKGYFEFRLCPHNNVHTPATQACLDQHLLQVEVNRVMATKYQLGTGTGTFRMNVLLPQGVTCSQCIFQWKYRTGNNWGCEGSDCGLGKGPQEHFVNCADIEITQSGQPQTQTPDPFQTSTPNPTPRTTPVPTPAATLQPSTAAPATLAPTTSPSNVNYDNCRAIGEWTGQIGMTNWCKTNCALGNCPASHCLCGASTLAPTSLCLCDASTLAPTSNYDNCRAIGAWTGQIGMTNWCKTNCALGNCPASRCLCGASTLAPTSNYDNCRAIGEWTGQIGMTNWCKTNCALGNCPASHCLCGASTLAPTSNYDNCRAIGAWTGQIGMTNWCKTNCALGNCPASHCLCGASTLAPTSNYDNCRAIGEWTGQIGMTNWCKTNCAHNPPFCPSSRCDCS